MKKTNLPPHWQIKRLGDVCKIYSGYGFPKNLQGQNDGKYPFYKVGDISRNVQKGHVYLNFCENYINEEIVDSLRMKLFPVNTVVFAKIGEALKLNRRAIMKEKGVVDNNAIGIKAREGFCEDKYLYYFMNTVKLEDYSRATTVPSVRKTDIEEIQIPIPPLPEQEQIVAKIEELFSELDAGVENIKTAQEQLKVYRQSLLKWAFEGKLTNEDVKDGELPEGWKKMKVSEVAETFGGYAFKSSSFVRNGKYQVIRMGNIRPGVLRLNENPVFVENTEDIKVMRSLLIYNDILITQTGTKGKKDYGYTVLVKKDNLLLNQRIACIRCGKKCLPGFFLYYSWTDKFRDQFFSNETGNVGQGNVGMKAITDSFVYIPPLPEQLKIVEELESRLTVCDKLEEDIKFSLKRAESLRQSILKQAFEGKLVNFNINKE